MRFPIQQVAGSVSRGLYAVAATPRVQRCFHQSTFGALPRKRTFFTSNPLLMASNHGEKGDKHEQHNDDLTPEQQHKPETSAVRGKLKGSAMSKMAAAPKKSKLRMTKAANRKPPVTEGSDDPKDFTQSIKAVCVADSFNMDIIKEILEQHNYIIDPDGIELSEEEVIHARTHNNSDIFFFPDGTAVAWGAAASNIVDIAQKLFSRAAANPHRGEPEFETILFSEDNTSYTSYMKGEEAVLGTKALEEGKKRDVTLAKIAFAKGLSRAPKLDYLETYLADVLGKLKPSVELLKVHQKKPRLDQTLRMTGELLSIRAELNYYSDLTNPSPDIFWEEQPMLEDIVRQVGREFNTPQRIKHMNDHLDYGNEFVVVLREMAGEEKSLQLERIIVWLILIEVTFGMYWLSFDIAERFFSDGESGHKVAGSPH